MILIENFQLKPKKVKEEKGAMISRIYDGSRWYYNSTTDISILQAEVDKLAEMAKPNPFYKAVIRLSKSSEVSKEAMLKYQDSNVSKINAGEKQSLLDTYVPVVKEFPQIKMSRIYYLDKYTNQIISSKGTVCEFPILLYNRKIQDAGRRYAP